jgi:coenzyme F420-reducing hydrogenase beta subunit
MALPSDCCGCFACVNVCPKSAIEMRENSEGFLYPVVNNNLCIHCGACEKVCPIINEVPNNCVTAPTAFAAKINDEVQRAASSSGGIFSALAINTINRNGVVWGVAFDEHLELQHIGVETIEALSKLQGSKYFQAAVGLSYKAVKKELKTGRPVLFSGTPCQIAGLYGYLAKNDYPNLLTIDVICHGVPSPKVFRRYVQEKEFQDKAQLKQIYFRDKKHGWKSYSVTRVMACSTGEALSPVLDRKSETLKENSFMRAFLRNICLRPSCHNCHYAKFPRIADITLGDYWGIQTIHPEFDDDKGTSLVLLNSSKGIQAWNDIQNQITAMETDLETAIRFNPSVHKSCQPDKSRMKFFAELETKPFHELVEKYCKKPSMVQRVWDKFKRGLRRMVH